jgi:hypothetical protein
MSRCHLEIVENSLRNWPLSITSQLRTQFPYEIVGDRSRGGPQLAFPIPEVSWALVCLDRDAPANFC